MFDCEYCGKSFSRKDNLKRHGDCRSNIKVCQPCGDIQMSGGALQRHLREKHQQSLKRKTGTPAPLVTKKKPKTELQG